MKKIIFILLIFSSFTSEACDVCGCGIGGYYTGIMPQFNRNFVGIRYRFQSFVTHPESQHFRTEESYGTAEVWARFQLNKNLQISGFLPYRFNEQKRSESSNRLSGIGDPLLLLNYTLFRSADSVWKQQWQIGGGIKAPLGEFRYDENNPNETANPNFQRGTGSWDFVLRTDYILRRKRSGLSLSLSGQFNGKNANDYQFGNRYTSQIQLFTIRQFGKVGLMPRLNLSAERAEKDRQSGQSLAESGGTALTAGAGLDFFYKQAVLGFSFDNPLTQQMAAGAVRSEARLSAHFSFIW